MKYWSQTFCASSLEASVYRFGADCCLVMAECTVPVHTSTQTHTAAHLQSHWTQTRREIPTSACASDVISWPGPLPPTSKLEDVFWHESLLFILLGVFITLPGTAQTTALGHASSYLSLHFLMGCRRGNISIARQFMTVYNCIGFVQHFENIVLFRWKMLHSTNASIIY